MANSIFIDPATGGYKKIGSSQFATISNGVNELNLALLQPVNTWIYGDGGNPLLSIDGIATMEQVKQAIAYCAAPIIASGALVSVEVKSYKLTPFKRGIIEIVVICPIYGEQELTWSQPN
jgi:hypothetical protein